MQVTGLNNPQQEKLHLTRQRPVIETTATFGDEPKDSVGVSDRPANALIVIIS
jgi:hypothetical protein